MSSEIKDIRHDWTREEVLALLRLPLNELLARAKETHKKYADQDVQKCVLLSVKTGGCPEDCGYCSQSVKFSTSIKAEGLLEVEKVVEAARNAKSNGATRFCMGAAWRDIPDDKRFEKVLGMIKGVADQGLEVCCTLGMATENQLERMKDAGLTAYNHNLDSGPDFYPEVVSTRTYQERIDTLRAARKSGVQLCSGGILGLGEGLEDRAAMLVELSSLSPHPESVPINLLVPVEGTRMENNPPVPFEDFLRMIAVARITLPESRVRLSAGRNTLSADEQLRCFEAGANSIFAGDKLLTAPNVDWDEDEKLLARMPLEIRPQSPSPRL